MKNFNPDQFFDLSNYAHASLFQGATYIWEILPKINSYLSTLSLGQIQAEIPLGAYLVNPSTISIGKGTQIEPGAYIKGPCVIGENCVIRHGAYIRGDFICGDHCVIGHDTEIKNAVMLDNSHAAHFAYVGDSILGNHVNLGAGTKCANLKFDNSDILVFADRRPIATHLRKLGAIIGDHSQIGCNVVTNPGTFIGKRVYCYPCVNVSGLIPPNCIVKSNAQQQIFAKTTKG
jgi:NDP-sugar pyrophosphorylase family protein